jgi:hypothetical protein
MDAKSAKRFSCLLAFGILGGQLSGCSILFSKEPPPPYRRTQPFECSGYALPIVDAIGAGATAVTILNRLATGKDKDRTAAVVPGLLVMAMWVASAGHGNSNAAKCSKAKEDATDSRRNVPLVRQPSSIPLEPMSPPAAPADLNPRPLPDSPFQD